jgi:hypothetical protein
LAVLLERGSCVDASVYTVFISGTSGWELVTYMYYK